MIRYIIFFFSIGLFFNFSGQADENMMVCSNARIKNDTVPFRVDEALIQKLSSMPQSKTWRDSGYYFQFERISWQVIRLGNTQNGDVIMLTAFSSADPSSLRFEGKAVFRFDPKDFPSEITPSKSMEGEAVLSFPQDVLFCPSPSQEVGLGQNDPYFPLYMSGEITGVNAAGGDFLYFETPMSVQLRDMEIIL